MPAPLVLPAPSPPAPTTTQGSTFSPDAGTSEGTRLGEGSREFVCEGHRVSCLVPTSGGSGRGVNFGVLQANISLG